MTTEQLYKLSIIKADEAYADFKSTCQRIREGKETELVANTLLNNVIALCWQLKNAAMDREPAPIPKRPTKKSVTKGV